MRHVLSLVVALVLTPVIYVTALISAARLGEAMDAGSLTAGPAAIGFFAAVISGGLYAMLVLTRLSPVGPVLAGLAYLGLTVWAVMDHNAVTGLLRDVVKVVPDGSALAPATTALLAVPLLATVFSLRRWRRRADGGPKGYNAAPDYPPPPDTAAPAYQPTVPSLSDYRPSYYTPPSSPTSSPTSTTATMPTMDVPRYDQ
jgi:hypothetical protein